MNIQVRLSGTAFWGFNGHWLTFQKPGPIEMDWDTLPSPHKRSLVASIRGGKVVCSASLEELESLLAAEAREASTNGSKSGKGLALWSKEAKPAFVAPKSVHENGGVGSLTKGARALLFKPVPLIREYVASCNEARLLEHMLQCEEEDGGKQRKSVISLLKERLQIVETTDKEALRKALEEEQERKKEEVIRSIGHDAVPPERLGLERVESKQVDAVTEEVDCKVTIQHPSSLRASEHIEEKAGE